MSKRIAMFIGQLTQNYQTNVVEAAVAMAKDLGYTAEIFSDLGTYGENYLHAEGERNIINLPYLEDYAGIVLAPDTFNVKGMYEELADKIQSKACCPVVTLRYEDERFYNVKIDDIAAISDIVEHFITIHGFRNICFMSGRMEMQDAQRRLQGYRETMGKYKLPVSEHMIFEGDYWRNKGEAAVDWFLGGEQYPEAIVCSNDYMAISVIEALRARNIRVPEDISVSGFDNIDEAQYSAPPIATVDVPAREMGQAAVRTIHELINGGTSPKYIFVPVKRKYEGSCGCGNASKNNQITELYNYNQYLGHAVRQITFMNVDFENCDNLEELLNSAFIYSLNFVYDTLYLCVCDNYIKTEKEILDSEKYSEKMVLRAVLSSKRGIDICEESFDRREILPERYKAEDEALYLFPLHYKNHCLGYLAMQAGKIDCLKEIFSSWITMVSSFIDKINLYVENRSLMEFREQSLRDELTGLHNRRMLEKVLKARCQNTFVSKIEFCILSIDMDGLKFINDTFGHMEGDAALCALAAILKSFESDKFIAARVGGDEFTVCIDTGCDGEIQAITGKIESKIQEYNRRSGKPYRLSASMGYAFYQEDKDLTDCMDRADKNMYTDKAKKKKEGSCR